jgi:hypothetical protein
LNEFMLSPALLRRPEPWLRSLMVGLPDRTPAVSRWPRV